MSVIHTLTIKRGASFVGSPFDAQIDNISPIVIATSGGAIPANTSWCISLYPVSILNGDHLYDATKTTRLYTVSGNVEQFDEHTEATISQSVTVNP